MHDDKSKISAKDKAQEQIIIDHVLPALIECIEREMQRGLKFRFNLESRKIERIRETVVQFTKAKPLNISDVAKEMIIEAVNEARGTGLYKKSPVGPNRLKIVVAAVQEKAAKHFGLIPQEP